ncbi:MAG: DRTGG domain-containing protein [Chloroflexi bacterium]|nr:DRTGG domain-containing protein [Chloroflexota bacterium]
MPLLSVISDTPGAGKTGVAAAVARDLAYTGQRVWLVRGEGSGDASNAAEDAHWFSTIEFAPGSASTPVGASMIPPPSGDEIVVAELQEPLERSDATILVTRGLPDEARVSEVAPTAVVALDVAASALVEAPDEVGGAPLIAVAEDRTLAGFSVSEAQATLRAETLVEGDGLDPTCDHLVIAPIGSDSGQPYLERFETKAVVVRFDKTDQHLAALATEPACLILTGGRRPSEYLFDAASARGVPVMLSRTDTENTVIALEGIFDRTRFHGERKLERMAELLGAAGLSERVAAALG